MKEDGLISHETADQDCDATAFDKTQVLLSGEGLVTLIGLTIGDEY